MSGKESKLFEGYKKIGPYSSQEAEEKVKEEAKAHFVEARIYAVLDFAVGFGIYKDGEILLKLDDQKNLVPLDWKYLKELRIFSRDGELCLKPIKEQWVGRFRGQIPDCPKTNEEQDGFFIDENQKLWGKAEKYEEINNVQWSLLKSDRGTRIWVPIELEKKELPVYFK